MVLQLEDCTDILKDIHPSFDFMFLYDHLCGYNRIIEDRLNVMNMNSGYVVSKQEMHPTKICCTC